MIKIIPYGERELHRRSLAKLWNWFPDEEFCMVIPRVDYDQFYRAKRIARYYLQRGKDFSVEADPVKYSYEIERLLVIGVRKFYLPWSGLKQGLLFSSSTALEFALWVTDKYKDAKVTIVFNPRYIDLYNPPDLDQIDTSFYFLANFVKRYPNIYASFRRPHPWYGGMREKKCYELESLIPQQEKFSIEPPCGYLTVVANTFIYCCPFCKRKEKKINFGNAARDKFVVGTVSRGIFRDIVCNECSQFPNAKKQPIKYILQGVK